MAARIGRCANELFCSIASADEDVLVRDGEAFVCPKCGKKLFEAPSTQGRAPPRAVLIGVAVVTLAAGGFIIGRGLVVGPPPPPPASAQVILPAPATRNALTPTGPIAVASVAAAAPALPPAVTPAPPPLASPDQAAPRPALPVGAAAPAPQPAASVAPPHVTQALALSTPQLVPTVAAAPPASPATRPVPQKLALLTPARPVIAKPPVAAPRPALPPPTTRNAPSKQTTAIAAPQAPPQIVAPVPPPKVQVAIAAAAPPRAAEPAAPRGEDRPFHAAPVSGGGPAYPHDYEDEGRAGSVTISCTIQTSGFPSGCHVLNVQGGNAFSAAVIKWVGSGRVRFAPILRNGQPVAETHQWAVSFAAP